MEGRMIIRKTMALHCLLLVTTVCVSSFPFATITTRRQRRGQGQYASQSQATTTAGALSPFQRNSIVASPLSPGGGPSSSCPSRMGDVKTHALHFLSPGSSAEKRAMINNSNPPSSEVNNPSSQHQQHQQSSSKSKLVLEFDSMMEDFVRYTPAEIDSVDDHRYRILYRGVAAGALEYPILRAFEILYEDLVPVRVAGRMIFKHLRNVMERSVDKRQRQVRAILDVTDFMDYQVQTGGVGRELFLAIDADGDGVVTSEELVESGFIDALLSHYLHDCGYDDVVVSRDRVIERMMDLEGSRGGTLDYEGFMIGMHNCLTMMGGKTITSGTTGDFESSSSVEDGFLDDIQRRVEEQRVGRRIPRPSTSREKKKRKHSQRYDDMVKSFAEWEESMVLPGGRAAMGGGPGRDGRLYEVLRGCFAGAKNPYVVNALKVVYTDYAALRVGGDLIYSLMRKLVRPEEQTTTTTTTTR